MVAGTDAFTRLAELELAIADASGLERVCTALEAGPVSRGSTAAARAAVAEGNATVESCLLCLQEMWTLAGADPSASPLALVLRTRVASVAAFRRQVPNAQVVWTGPRVEGSFLRATRAVVRELLAGAHTGLLVVGYWMAARDDGKGIIEEVIASLADAVTRGVTVSVVVDERVRPEGRDNRRVLVSAWPLGVTLPRTLTWRLPPGDQHLKLHSVSDRRDALVTSANMTSYAMDRNMEMGVRIVGHPAFDIARHFNLLATNGVLEPYAEERDPP